MWYKYYGRNPVHTGIMAVLSRAWGKACRFPPGFLPGKTMICEVEYCPSGKDGDKGANNNFGVLCSGHNLLWLEETKKAEIPRGTHPSVERRLYVGFKERHKAKALATVPKTRQTW